MKPALGGCGVAGSQWPLRAGLLAAGFGSRMRESGGGPKALTLVAGRPLIDWVLDDIEEANVSEIVIIINEQSLAVCEHVESRRRSCRIRWIVETTPSSMHSFLRVVEELARRGDDGPFLVSTVDTIAPPGTFRQFVEAARHLRHADVILPLTTRMEDDKPLKVEIRRLPEVQGGEITALGGDGAYATAGYYLVRASVLREAAACRAENLGALRLFFQHLLDCGCRLAGICMPDSIDVDRPADVGAAEMVLRTENG